MSFFEAEAQTASSFAQLEYTGPVVYKITLHSQSASVLYLPHCSRVAPEMLQECCGSSPVQVMHLLSQRGAAARQDSFLHCRIRLDWPVTWRGSEMTEPKALCGGVEGQTQLCLSHLLTEGPAPQRHRERSWLVEWQVWGPQEWDVSRVKSINKSYKGLHRFF